MKTFLALFIASLLFVMPVYAETYFNVGTGLTQFQRTTPDGTWYQEALPHNFDLIDIAFRSNLEYEFAEHWSVSGGYVNLGTSRVRADAVADKDYDIATHTCLANCNHPKDFNVKDNLSGPELFVTYKFLTGPVQPYVTAGGSYMFHSLKGTANTFKFETDGNIVMGRVGGGVCYGYLCGDVTYYHGMTGQDEAKFPISQRAITSMVFLSLPLTGW